MKKAFLLLPIITLLTACPTPPENVPNNGQAGNNAPTGQPKGPPPGQPPEGGDPGNLAPGQQPNGDPSTDAAEQPPGEEPTAEADAPAPQEGEDGVAEQKTEETPDKQGDVPVPGQPPQVPEQDKPPEGGIVTDSLLIRVDRIPSKPPIPKSTQEEVGKESHVTYSGKATCSDCSEKLILRAVRFIGPNAAPTENDVITQKEVSAGDFTILIPKSDEGIALELLVDTDNNGYPSAGERFAVIEMGGQLIPTSDRGDLSLDASDRKVFKQAPAPGGTPAN